MNDESVFMLATFRDRIERCKYTLSKTVDIPTTNIVKLIDDLFDFAINSEKIKSWMKDTIEKLER